MQKVGFGLIVAALSSALLFLIYPVALTIGLALIEVFAPNPLGGPWWLILAALFAAPLVAVALIFRGTYLSLRRG